MHELARRLREVVVATDSYRRTMADALDIATTEAAVLGHLLHDGPQTPSVIAARAGLTPASGTGLLDRLETAGMVERRPHPRDRRSLLVDLTGRGRAAITAQFVMFAEDLERALAQADPRLVEDPALRRLVTELFTALAAALRSRAGDLTGIRAALHAEMDAVSGERVED